jgi:hypothetical protein
VHQLLRDTFPGAADALFIRGRKPVKSASVTRIMQLNADYDDKLIKVHGNLCKKTYQFKLGVKDDKMTL